MKKSITLSILTASLLFAQTLSVKPGYQLIGAPDGVELTKLDNSCISYIFNYKNNGWKVYIADGQEYETNSTLSEIKRGDGFWAYGNDACDVSVNDIPETIVLENTPYITNGTQVQVDENNPIALELNTQGSLNTPIFSIVGGADHYLFEIENNSTLKFKQNPDFENPLDLLADNTYEVRVQAADGNLKSEKTFIITVNDLIDYFRIENRFFDVIKYLYSLPSYDNGSPGDPSYFVPAYAGAKGEVSFSQYSYIDPSGNEHIDTHPYGIQQPSSLTFQSITCVNIDPDDYSTDLQCTGEDMYYQMPKSSSMLGEYRVNLSLTDLATGERLDQNLTYEVLSMDADIPAPTTQDIELYAKVGVEVELPFKGTDPNGYYLMYHPNVDLPYSDGFQFNETTTFDLNDSRIQVTTAYDPMGTTPTTDKGKFEYKDGKWYFTAYEAGDDNFIHFQYYASNGASDNGGTGYDASDVNITIVDNFPPVIKDMTVETYEDTPYTLVLNAVDAERDIVTYTVTAQNGTVTPMTDIYGENRWIYTPNKNFHGTDTITYSANDGVNDSGERTITITVDGVNDKPRIETPPSLIELTPKKITQYSEVIDENSLFYVTSTLARDYDQEDLNFTVTIQPTNGEIKVHPDGGIVYAPNYNFTGSDTFSIKAQDSSSEESNEVSFTI